MSASQSVSALQFQAVCGQSKVTGSNVCISFCTAIMYIAVALKLLSKRISRKAFTTDDGLIILSLILGSMVTASFIVGIHYGLGRHLVCVKSLKGVAISIKLDEILYIFVITTVKLSVISLYDSIFPNRNTPNQRVYHYGKRVLRVFVASQCLAFLVVTIFECLPFKKLWDPTIPGHCLELRASTIVAGSLNVFTDIAILALPLQPILKLKLSWRRKQLIYGNFLLGGMVCVISLVRTIYLKNWGDDDPTYDNVDASNLSLVEISFAILCACVPMYLPLVKFCKRLKQGSRSSQSGDSYRELAERPSTQVWSESAEDRPVHSGIHVTRTLENQV